VLLAINIPHSVALRGAYRSATDYASSMIAIGAGYTKSSSVTRVIGLETPIRTTRELGEPP
jgi:hypothetical protein